VMSLLSKWAAAGWPVFPRCSLNINQRHVLLFQGFYSEGSGSIPIFPICFFGENPE
jgi:hypothetical protein